MNHVDLPSAIAEPLILAPKFAPEGNWRSLSQGKNEKWEYAVGMVSDDPSLRKSLVMQLHAMRTLRPKMVSYQFGLFYREYGAFRRAYMLETGHPQLGVEGDHSWPHEHRGANNRIIIPANDVPILFVDVLNKFITTCSITLESSIDDPFEFKLKP